MSETRVLERAAALLTCARVVVFSFAAVESAKEVGQGAAEATRRSRRTALVVCTPTASVVFLFLLVDSFVCSSLCFSRQSVEGKLMKRLAAIEAKIGLVEVRLRCVVVVVVCAYAHQRQRLFCACVCARTVRRASTTTTTRCRRASSSAKSQTNDIDIDAVAALIANRASKEALSAGNRELFDCFLVSFMLTKKYNQWQTSQATKWQQQ